MTRAGPARRTAPAHLLRSVVEAALSSGYVPFDDRSPVGREVSSGGLP